MNHVQQAERRQAEASKIYEESPRRAWTPPEDAARRNEERRALLADLIDAYDASAYVPAWLMPIVAKARGMV